MLYILKGADHSGIDCILLCILYSITKSFKHIYTYLCFPVLSFLLTESLIFTCCVPLLVLSARYHYSRRVILGCLERTQNTDMSDIEKYYLKSPGKFAQNAKSPMFTFYTVELTPTVALTPSFIKPECKLIYSLKKSVGVFAHEIVYSWKSS